MPCRLGKARPCSSHTDSGRSSSQLRSSYNSRDFPTPASPMTSATRDLPGGDRLVLGLRAGPARRSRPTVRVSTPSTPRVAMPERPRLGPAHDVRPRSGPTSRVRRAVPARHVEHAADVAVRVVRRSARLPIGAACSRRLATLTVSPITVNSRSVPTAPTSAGPVLMPTRMADRSSGLGPERRRSAPCSARPARTARSTSCSSAASTPHSAITASPMCLSTCPPWSGRSPSSAPPEVVHDARSGPRRRASRRAR